MQDVIIDESGSLEGIRAALKVNAYSFAGL